MTTSPGKQRGHSAKVQLWMEIEGKLHPLNQAADTWVMPAEKWDHPPVNAVIIMDIDGSRFCRNVTLPNGISPSDRFVVVHGGPCKPVIHQAEAV